MLDKLKGLKRIFIEEIPDEPKQVEVVIPKPAASRGTVSIAPIPDVDVASVSVPLSVPERVTELRRQVVPQTGQLSTFTSMLAVLEAHIPNEATRFKAAAQAVAAQGITPTSISAEITEIFTRVEDHKNRTEVSRNAKVKTQVTDKQEEIKKLSAVIAEKQVEIGKLAAEQKSLEKAVEEAEVKIKERSWEWEAARATIIAEFTEFSRKLSIYFDDKKQGASK